MHPFRRHVRAALTSAVRTFLPLAVVLTAGCYVRPAEGAFPCMTAADCPGGWVCRTDELCWSTDDAACPAGQHFERSIAECREDLDAPVIHITPATPRTLDDLAVVIDTPTVETLRPGAGPITYRYEWSRDGAAVPTETTAGIDAELTTRDEVWRVEVTPITDDGLEGPVAMAMVTIANTPPVLTTVGLSSYWPVEGETLAAIPGSLSDDDGDSMTVRYAWTVDGAPIDAPGAGFLPTPEDAGLAARVEAWADDGTDPGERVSAGPVVILSNVARWIPLLPSLPNAALMFDERNERFVGYSAGLAWEAFASVSGIVVRPLSPRGVPLPAGFAPSGSLIRDEINDRMIFMSPTEPGILYTLSLAERGHEEWSRLAASGTGPLLDAAARGSDSDASRGVIWVFGGLADRDPDVFVDELWSLNVSVVGAEAWERHPLDGTPPLGLAAPMLVTLGAGRLFLAGGFISGGVAQSGAYEINVDEAGDAHSALAGAQLPSPRVFSQGVLRGDLVTIIGGLTAFSETNVAAPTIVLDVVRGTVVSETAADPRGWHAAAGCESCETAAFMASNDADTLLTGTISPSGSVVPGSTRHVAGPHLDGSAWMIGRDFALIGGSAEPCADPEGLAIDSLEWRVLATSPDPRDGSAPSTCPTLRGNEFNGGLFVLDGSASPEAYVLNGTGEWSHRAYAVGATRLGDATGMASGVGGCGNGFAIGGIRGDLAALACDGPGTDCSWSIQPGLVGARLLPSIATVRGSGYSVGLVFGGANAASSPLGDLLAINACVTPPTAGPMGATGAAPPARWGHTFTPVTGEDGGGPQSVLVFGGSGASDERLNDLFELVVSSDHEARWQPVVVAGDARPAPRTRHAATWVTFTNRLLVFGGQTADENVGDLWELRLPRP